jgi:hypothetical protein
MIDEVMFEIREMTGQTYKNVYAGQADTEEQAPSRVASVVESADPSGAAERQLISA